MDHGAEPVSIISIMMVGNGEKKIRKKTTCKIKLIKTMRKDHTHVHDVHVIRMAKVMKDLPWRSNR